MNKAIVISKSYFHPEVEAHLNKVEAELKDFVTVQAKEDTKEETELSETLFHIKVTMPVHNAIQTLIDNIRKILLPTSLVFDAVEIDTAARKKVQTKEREKNDKLLHKASLVRKLNEIIIDPLKKKYRKVLLVVAVLVGAGDAALAYSSFRFGGYSVPMALLASLAIGSVIAVSHLFYAGWIKRAGTALHRVGRIFVILFISFIFFAWIGNLRANSANSSVNIALDGNTVSAVSTPHLNGWAIAIISFVLFVAILFLSLLFWRSKKERIDEEEYNRLQKEITTTQAAIDSIEKEIEAIEKAASIQKSEARAVYDYATASIRKAKQIGRSALTLYKQTYARFHSDVVPSFFSENQEQQYDESFQFITPTKTEKA
jgi:hypothetical protein